MFSRPMLTRPPEMEGAGLDIVVLGGHLLLTLLMIYPLVAHFGAAIPGDGFDGWQHYWNPWWVKTARRIPQKWHSVRGSRLS